jgi:hypothetical protein
VGLWQLGTLTPNLLPYILISFFQATSETHTEAIFSSGFDKDGHPYVARVYRSHVLQVSASHHV